MVKFKNSLIYFLVTKEPPPGGLEPPTFRLTAERASRLRHAGLDIAQNLTKICNFWILKYEIPSNKGLYSEHFMF